MSDNRHTLRMADLMIGSSVCLVLFAMVLPAIQ